MELFPPDAPSAPFALTDGILHCTRGFRIERTNWMLQWARPGDRSREFEETALVHLDTLYRSALRLTHNRAEAEDLVQEACLRGFLGFHRFNPGTNCRAWLLPILPHEFLTH